MVTLLISLTTLLYLLYVADSLSIPLFLIFLILKLCNVIAWSWVLVCLPLIIGVVTGVLTFVFALLAELID